MSINVSPEIESTVLQYAVREGVTVDELLARTFPPIVPDVSALLRRWQQQYGLPERPAGKGHISIRQLTAKWNDEDAQLTPDEISEEQRAWELHEREHHRVEI